MPPADGDRVVVWRAGGAILAAPLDAVVEIAAVGDDGRAAGRAGPIPLTSPAGAEPRAPKRAVVVRVGERTLALAADAVEGVARSDERVTAPTPRWLRGLAADRIARLVRLEEGRVAAVLDLERIAGP